MKFAILINGKRIVGPYTKRESAQNRADNLMASDKRIKAIVMPMTPDSEYFGKPVGNRTNH